MIKTVCAWCGKFLGTKHDSKEGVSHGICETCRCQYFNLGKDRK